MTERYHPQVEEAYITSGEDTGRVDDKELAVDLATTEADLRNSGADSEKVGSLVKSRAKFILGERAFKDMGVSPSDLVKPTVEAAQMRKGAGGVLVQIDSDLNRLKANSQTFKD